MTVEEFEAKLLAYAIGIKDTEAKQEFCKHFDISVEREGKIIKQE